MLNTADRPRPNDSRNKSADASVDTDFGTGGKGVETMGNGLGGWSGEGFGGCGIAAGEC